MNLGTVCGHGITILDVDSWHQTVTVQHGERVERLHMDHEGVLTEWIAKVHSEETSPTVHVKFSRDNLNWLLNFLQANMKLAPGMRFQLRVDDDGSYVIMLRKRNEPVKLWTPSTRQED